MVNMDFRDMRNFSNDQLPDVNEEISLGDLTKNSNQISANETCQSCDGLNEHVVIKAGSSPGSY